MHPANQINGGIAKMLRLFDATLLRVASSSKLLPVLKASMKPVKDSHPRVLDRLTCARSDLRPEQLQKRVLVGTDLTDASFRVLSHDAVLAAAIARLYPIDAGRSQAVIRSSNCVKSGKQYCVPMIDSEI